MIGCDIISISRVEEALSARPYSAKQAFMSDNEMQEFPTIQSIAGVWAAKEACIKAYGGGILMSDIYIHKLPSGKPIAIINGESIDISISHDNGMAFAVAIKRGI